MGQRNQKSKSQMKRLRNNQGIIILLALAMVIGMSAVFIGNQGPVVSSPGTSSAPIAASGSVTDLVNRGNQAYDNGHFADAISYYEKALEGNPNMVGVLVDLGTAYWYLQPPLPSKAVELYDQAIAIEPTFINAYFNKGVVLFYGLNKPQEAIEAWEKALSLNPPANFVDEINAKLIPAAKEALNKGE